MRHAAMLPIAIAVAACPPVPDRVLLAPPAFGSPRPKPKPGDCAVRLEFTEILYDPDAMPDAAGEYVELVNTGGTRVDLTGFRLQLNDRRARPLSRGQGPVLEPAGVLVIAGSQDVPVLPGSALSVVRRLGLPNSHAHLALLDPCGGIAAQVSYGTEQPWPGPRPGRAIERVDLSAAASDGASWRYARGVLPGGDRGSPGVLPQAEAQGQRLDGAADGRYGRRMRSIR